VLKLPLFTSDSGAYLLNTYNDKLPIDRPVFYSWFIAIFKNSGLRYLAAFQAFILAVLYAQVLNKLGALRHKLNIVVATLVYILSGIPLLALQVMPDAFTPALFLAMYLMLISRGLTAIRYGILLLIFCLFHFSHVAITLVCLVIYFIIVPRIRTTVYFLSPALAIIIMSWVNYNGGLGFKPSPASHVYFMGKMAENGIAQRFLNDNCTTNNFALCEYRQQLKGHAWNFIWSENGAFVATGGWQNSAKEYNEIIKQTLVHPKYLNMHIQAAFWATLNQIWRSHMGDGMYAMDLKSNVFEHLSQSIPRDLYLFTQSRQNSKASVPFKEINNITAVMCILGLICLLAICFGSFTNKNMAVFITMLCIFVIANAFVTGALANVLSRLNSRALLLFPALIIPLFCSQFLSKSPLLKSKF
jgi:hypothetical protein